MAIVLTRQKAKEPLTSVRVVGLNPKLAKDMNVIVLGSMPGLVSLAERKYYAYPQNRFWRVMHEVVGVDASYAQRVAALLKVGIGLWDVIESCERRGSLDGAIVSGNEVPNDLVRLVQRRSGIRAFAFNGGKAFTVFRRLVTPALGTNSIDYLALPSTSPANTSYNMRRLVQEWRRIEPYLKLRDAADRTTSPRRGPGYLNRFHRTGD